MMLQGGRDLADHRAEAREEQRGHVELAGGEQRQDLLGDPLGVLEAELPDAPELDHLDDPRGEQTLQLVEALLADAEDLDLLAVVQQPIERARGRAGRWTS